MILCTRDVIKLLKKLKVHGITVDYDTVEFTVGDVRCFIREVTEDLFDGGVVDIPKLNVDDGYFRYFSEELTSDDIEDHINEVKEGKYNWVLKLRDEFVRLESRFSEDNILQMVQMRYETNGGFKTEHLW